jgi:NTP pyrophosphatase (non-canonical NTP hydrolase)
MSAQREVAAFLDDHDMRTAPAYRLLDLSAEVGEVAADAAKSSDYGENPEALTVTDGELGDALFSLLALADELGMDAGAALETSIEKYADRVEETGGAGSDDAQNR